MRLFLVGPPGVGKTVVGRELARVLGAAFLDVDEAVERITRKPNARTIIDDGMERFRDLESEVIGRLRPTPAWEVVATGGGSPIRPDNRARMRSLGLIVGLRGSIDHVARGIERTMDKREHLRRQGFAPREAAAHAIRSRREAYADVDVGFDADGSGPDEVARAIAAWIVSARGIRVDVAASRAYPVLVRAGLLAHVGRHLADLGWSGRIAVVGDRVAMRAHVPPVAASLRDAGMEPVPVRVPSSAWCATATWRRPRS